MRAIGVSRVLALGCGLALGLGACGGGNTTSGDVSAGTGGADGGSDNAGGDLSDTGGASSAGAPAGGSPGGGALSGGTPSGGAEVGGAGQTGGAPNGGTPNGGSDGSTGGNAPVLGGAGGSGGTGGGGTGGVRGGGTGGVGGAETGGAPTGGAGGAGGSEWLCDNEACVPGAVCDPATGWCECAEGYEGDGWWCLATTPCSDSPCQNGGTCHPTVGDRVLCTCPAGWGGVHCEVACTGEVPFPDANLAAAVRSAAGIEDGQPITGEAIADVTSLTIGATPIGELEGIECMPSLSWVTIFEAGLTDLTAFASLPRLASLEVDCNSFTDLSPLASLVNLVELNIGKSSSCTVPGQVMDLAPLEDLVGLSFLDVSGHDIDSLEPLQALTHMQRLIAASNADLASLAGLENMDSLEYFVATDTLVSDVSIFAEHPTLQTLWLSGSDVADLTPLLSAGALEDLYVRATNVDCTAQASNLAALAANGVLVSSDCE